MFHRLRASPVKRRLRTSTGFSAAPHHVPCTSTNIPVSHHLTLAIRNRDSKRAAPPVHTHHHHLRDDKRGEMASLTDPQATGMLPASATVPKARQRRSSSSMNNATATLRVSLSDVVNMHVSSEKGVQSTTFTLLLCTVLPRRSVDDDDTRISQEI